MNKVEYVAVANDVNDVLVKMIPFFH